MTTFLRISEVLERVGLSRAAVYAAIKRKEFPRGVLVGKRARRWPTDEIETWQQERRAAG